MTEKVPNRKIFNEFEIIWLLKGDFLSIIISLESRNYFFRAPFSSVRDFPFDPNGQGFFEGSSAYSKAWNLGYEIKI